MYCATKSKNSRTCTAFTLHTKLVRNCKTAKYLEENRKFAWDRLVKIFTKTTPLLLKLKKV